MAEFVWREDLPGLLVAWLVIAVFIHFAAKIVLDRSSFGAALLTALVGTLLAGLVGSLVDGRAGFVLALLTWGLVCALVYRTGWVKALVVGLVAWVLYILVVWAIGQLFG